MRYPAFLLATLLLPAVNPAAASDPKLRVKLSEESLVTGEKAKVRVKAAENGYLVVLRMDTEGHVRVIYPVDPTDAGQIRGGKEFEVKSRGDREAFTAAEKSGSGVVLAARADQPFRFDAFVNGSRWNGAAFSADSSLDAEEALLSVVDRMGGGQYDYDAVRYTVGAPLPRRTFAGRYYDPRFFNAGWNSWYDPWFMNGYLGAFGWSPYYYGPSLRYTRYVYVRRPVYVRGGGGRRR